MQNLCLQLSSVLKWQLISINPFILHFVLKVPEGIEKVHSPSIFYPSQSLVK